MIIFVTGFHRAGTHSAAKHKAKQKGLLYIEEGVIQWDSLRATKMILSGNMPKWVPDSKNKWRLTLGEKLKTKGFVLQCPGLAHKTKWLSEKGEVFWCSRNPGAVVKSMKANAFNEMTWHLMNQLHTEFPNDGIWSTLKYDGSEDMHNGFEKYHTLYCDVKQHFYEKYYKNITTQVELEKQGYYVS